MDDTQPGRGALASFWPRGKHVAGCPGEPEPQSAAVWWSRSNTPESAAGRRQKSSSVARRSKQGAFRADQAGSLSEDIKVGMTWLRPREKTDAILAWPHEEIAEPHECITAKRRGCQCAGYFIRSMHGTSFPRLYSGDGIRKRLRDEPMHLHSLDQLTTDHMFLVHGTPITSAGPGRRRVDRRHDGGRDCGGSLSGRWHCWPTLALATHARSGDIGTRLFVRAPARPHSRFPSALVNSATLPLFPVAIILGLIAFRSPMKRASAGSPVPCLWRGIWSRCWVLPSISSAVAAARYPRHDHQSRPRTIPWSPPHDNNLRAAYVHVLADAATRCSLSRLVTAMYLQHGCGPIRRSGIVAVLLSPVGHSG